MQAHIIIHELMQSDTLQRPIIISGRMQIFAIIQCLSCMKIQKSPTWPNKHRMRDNWELFCMQISSWIKWHWKDECFLRLMELFLYLHTGSDFLWRYPSIDRWSDGNNPSTWLTLIFPIPPSSLNISGFSVCIFSAVGNIVNNNQMHSRLRAWSNRFFHKSIITLNFLPRHSFLCELC